VVGERGDPAVGEVGDAEAGEEDEQHGHRDETLGGEGIARFGCLLRRFHRHHAGPPRGGLPDPNRTVRTNVPQGLIVGVNGGVEGGEREVNGGVESGEKREGRREKGEGRKEDRRGAEMRRTTRRRGE